MANVKIERLNHAFQQEISMIIMREVKNENIKFYFCIFIFQRFLDSKLNCYNYNNIRFLNTGKVTISAANGALVYDNTAVIKTTGEDFSVTAGVMIATVAAVLVIGAVAVAVITKKNGLLAK